MKQEHFFVLSIRALPGYWRCQDNLRQHLDALRITNRFAWAPRVAEGGNRDELHLSVDIEEISSPLRRRVICHLEEEDVVLYARGQTKVSR